MAKGKFSLNFDAIEALFKPKMPPLIGADISSSAVKMVEIVDAGIAHRSQDAAQVGVAGEKRRLHQRRHPV